MLVYPPPFLGAQKSGKEANAMFFLTKKGKVQEFSSSAPPSPSGVIWGGGAASLWFSLPPPGNYLEIFSYFRTRNDNIFFLLLWSKLHVLNQYYYKIALEFQGGGQS